MSKHVPCSIGDTFFHCQLHTYRVAKAVTCTYFYEIEASTVGAKCSPSAGWLHASDSRIRLDNMNDRQPLKLLLKFWGSCYAPSGANANATKFNDMVSTFLLLSKRHYMSRKTQISTTYEDVLLVVREQEALKLFLNVSKISLMELATYRTLDDIFKVMDLAGIRRVLEPPGLSRSDGKRPVSLTLAPR